MSFDLALLQLAVDQLTRECSRLKGHRYQDGDLADHIYGLRYAVSTRRSMWSRFKHDSLAGKRPITEDEIDKVLDGFRNVIVKLHTDQGDPATAKTRTDAFISELARRLGLATDGHGKLLAHHFKRAAAFQLPPRTSALACHEPEEMMDFVSVIKYQASLKPDIAFEHVVRSLGGYFVDHRPASADLSRYQVVSDSILFDNSNWIAVDNSDLIRAMPIEPSLCTRVIRIKTLGASAPTIAFEFNNSGFGVVPLIARMHPTPRFLVQRGARMTESTAPTRTTYLEFDIPTNEVPTEHIFEIRCVYFNGLQESRGRQVGKWTAGTMEWHGKRMSPTTEEADLSVVFPNNPGVGEYRFAQRPESLGRDALETTQEADQRERIFEPATKLSGSTDETAKIIWKLPQVQELTIFSVQWRWKDAK